MSDELTPRRRDEEEGTGAEPDRSELAIALRGLAEDHEMPAAVPGAEIRRRAVRRRRRRKAALAAAGTACAGALAVVLAVVLSGGEDARSVPPAASYGASTPSAVPSATPEASPSAAAARVDLGRRELLARGRTLPVSSGTAKSPTPTGLMTVTAKYKSAMLPGEVAGWEDYQIEATWVIRLSGPDGRTTFLLALDWSEKAPGVQDVTGGAIGLRTADAMWLYGELGPGAVVEVVGPDPAQPGRKVTPSRTEPVRPPEPEATETGAADTATGVPERRTGATEAATDAATGGTDATAGGRAAGGTDVPTVGSGVRPEAAR